VAGVGDAANGMSMDALLALLFPIGLGRRSLSLDKDGLSMLGRTDWLSVVSSEAALGCPDMDDREGETSFGLATDETGVFDCRLDQNEKMPPVDFALVGESASAAPADCFSTIRHPIGTESSSEASFLCFTAVSHVVEPLAAK
jgi:hypothetical protein